MRWSWFLPHIRMLQNTPSFHWNTRPGHCPAPSFCHELWRGCALVCVPSSSRLYWMWSDYSQRLGDQFCKYWGCCVTSIQKHRGKGTKQQRRRRSTGLHGTSHCLRTFPNENVLGKEMRVYWKDFFPLKLPLKAHFFNVAFWTINPHFGSTGKPTRYYIC